MAVAVAGVDIEDMDHLLLEAADSEADAVASVAVEGEEVDREEEEEVEEAKVMIAVTVRSDNKQVTRGHNIVVGRGIQPPSLPHAPPHT